MTIVTETLFTVKGRGAFPIDMLRYDCAWPVTPIGVELIEESISGANRELGTNKWAVVLTSVRPNVPTVARWESFGCKIVEEVPMSSTIDRPSIVESEHLEYLDELRKSGVTNMYGAGSYVKGRFQISMTDARTILQYWMESLEERYPGATEYSNESAGRSTSHGQMVSSRWLCQWTNVGRWRPSTPPTRLASSAPSAMRSGYTGTG